MSDARQIFGIQPVREAIRAHGKRLARVLIEQGDHPQLGALARFARDQGIDVAHVTRAELDRQARGGRHQGVMAFAPPLELKPFEALPLDETSVLVVLDGLQDPQNFGAVVRSAVALGATAVVWPEHASAPLSPAAFRASAGAVEHATLCRVRSLPSTMHAAAAQGAIVLGLDGAATKEISDIDLASHPVLLVVGTEGSGLHGAVRKSCTHLVRLPMPGPIDSLNASVAAAIALFEVNRIRRSKTEHRHAEASPAASAAPA